MSNTIKKGYRSNSKVRKWLVENEYGDIHFFPHTRYIKDVEIGNAKFDGIATIGFHLVLFQVKSNKKPSKKLLREYARITNKYGVECLWFNVVDRKGVIVHTTLEVEVS